MIDARLVPDEQEVVTPGEAVAGRILNGLGCSHRPLALTPPFFANTPRDLLFREGVHAELCNRFQLGRTLEEVSAYGGDLLLSELALAGCTQDGMEQRFNHLDTTSLSLPGADVPVSDEQAITMTHGYAKDHRPDLQQAVWALMVAQDGGGPLVRKSWDGKTSDTQSFQERAKALMATLQHSPPPRDWVAEAKRDNEANAATLNTLGFLTRMPNTLQLIAQGITPARRWDPWHRLDDPTRYQRMALCHSGMAQRWLVGSSQGALERAEARITQACQREAAAIDKHRLHVQARRFETPEAAQAALATLEQSWKSHQVGFSSLIAHNHDAGTGRPMPTSPIKSIDWPMPAQARPAQEQMADDKAYKACCVVGTTMVPSQLSDPEVMRAYTGQAQAEGGLRFLTDPWCFVSSLCVKKPCRIQGLLRVMT
jgi:transposase